MVSDRDFSREQVGTNDKSNCWFFTVWPKHRGWTWMQNKTWMQNIATPDITGIEVNGVSLVGWEGQREVAPTTGGVHYQTFCRFSKKWRSRGRKTSL